MTARSKSTFAIPGFLSEQARAILATPAVQEPAYPPLDDTSAWLEYIKEGNAAFRAAIEPLAPDLPYEERKVAGVTNYVVAASQQADLDAGPVYLSIHGGALITGGGATARYIAAFRAEAIGMTQWAVDYRMPPLHPYPAALDDLIAVYRTLVKQRNAADIIVGGESAGGNLAAALLLRAKDEGLPMPAALVLLTPEVDLTESGDSFETLAALDTTLSSLHQINLLYAAGHDLREPYLSPLFGDPTGFPPTFLQSGTRDLFLSNTVRMHRKLRDVGVEAELHIWDARMHAGFDGAPEESELHDEMRRFIDKHRSNPDA